MNQEISKIEYNGYTITEKPITDKWEGLNLYYFSDKEGKEVISQTLEHAKERIDYLFGEN